MQRGYPDCAWPEPLRPAEPSESGPQGHHQRHWSLAPTGRVQPSSSFLVQFSDGLAGVPAAHAWEVIRNANRAIHGAYFDDHYTIVVACLPLLVEFPAYTHTWLALGAAQLAQQNRPCDGHWRLMALKCHSKAIYGLRKHLESNLVPHEWALCSTLLLHIFEKFGDEQQLPSGAHVSSARRFFIHRFIQFPPTNLRHLLQLESLIYRVAVTNLFQLGGEGGEDYTFLDTFVQIWAASNIQCGMWQHSLWIGLQPPLFNIVFKLTILLQRAPLDHLSALCELEENMREHLRPHTSFPPRWVDRPCQLEDSSQSALSLGEQSRIAHCVYGAAAWIVILKLRNPNCGNQQEPLEEISRLSYRFLRYLTRAKFFSPVLLWPMIIIGLTASNLEEQTTVALYINELADVSGSRASASAVGLLSRAWGRAENEDGAGIDALLDSEDLTTVFI